jgi:hypothetical protein
VRRRGGFARVDAIGSDLDEPKAGRSFGRERNFLPVGCMRVVGCVWGFLLAVELDTEGADPTRCAAGSEARVSVGSA